ncbi:histidine phosphatase family protein [Lysinibacillus sp. KCTC 33748]|uniref:histidine phosphatase family protein n=1 Tax=unclassified Lysinibacillus TaxID=2636778 RepID=UPI0009A7B863|nr:MULTISPECIES: histidine phosphatase family protein [unclassified Lysinibacillus]OXS76091.1 histidine phosphatase family protein [Lysinibacillus sp. KCTC 33748]SKB40442.1 Histidine phosphatase superfamily (branch 1) [Lysinibacillus sp. AC-3]
MDKSILDLLRKGGFVLYARHGQATVGVDQPYINFQDCVTQRNLSEFGRRQAVYFGQLLRHLQIPISSPIIVSPFCRTVETAQLAFPYSYIQIDPIGYGIYKLGGAIPFIEKNNILSNVQSALERKPSQGMNQVIVAHSFPEDIGLGKISNMGMVIVKPNGPGNGFEIIKKLTLEDLSLVN